MGRRYASVRVRVGFIINDDEEIDDILPHIVTMPVLCESCWTHLRGLLYALAQGSRA